jgi:hypothetical protein
MKIKNNPSTTATLNSQITRMDALKEASEQAERQRMSGSPLPNEGEPYRYSEYLGDTTPAEVKEMLYRLSNSNLFLNYIYATMKTFEKAKSVSVSVETQSIVGQAPVLKRIVITAHDQDQHDSSPGDAK